MTIIEYIRNSFGIEKLLEEFGDGVIPSGKYDSAEVIIEPDGYVRKSPKQDIYMVSDYRKKIMMRIAFIALVIVAFFVVFWGLWKIGLIKI